MKTNEVIRKVQSHRGRVYVGVLAKDDVFYTRAYKDDLLVGLGKVADDQLRVEVYGEDMFIHPNT